MAAIELIPKQKPKPIFGQVFFLIVSAALLIAVGTAFFLLQIFVSNGEEELAQLEQRFLGDTRPLEEELDRELRGYKRKTDLFKTILEEQRSWLPFFELLEATTHPDVFFQSLRGSTETGVVVLQGEARNFSVLEQQRLVWLEHLDAFESTLRSIQLEEGGRGSFEVEFVVNPELVQPL